MKTGKMKRIFETHSPQDIYNCGESDLLWQMIPERNLDLSDKSGVIENSLKLGLPCLVGSNTDVTDMMPILAISKSAKHPTFKKIKKLPVRYLSNRKAWIRSHIFSAPINSRLNVVVRSPAPEGQKG